MGKLICITVEKQYNFETFLHGNIIVTVTFRFFLVQSTCISANYSRRYSKEQNIPLQQGLGFQCVRTCGRPSGYVFACLRYSILSSCLLLASSYQQQLEVYSSQPCFRKAPCVAYSMNRQMKTQTSLRKKWKQSLTLGVLFEIATSRVVEVEVEQYASQFELQQLLEENQDMSSKQLMTYER